MSRSRPCPGRSTTRATSEGRRASASAKWRARSATARSCRALAGRTDDSPRRDHRRRQRRPPGPVADLLRTGAHGDLSTPLRVGLRPAPAACRTTSASTTASTRQFSIGVDSRRSTGPRARSARGAAGRSRRQVASGRSAYVGSDHADGCSPGARRTCTRSATGASRTSPAPTNTVAGAERLEAFADEAATLGLRDSGRADPPRGLLVGLGLSRDLRAARARRAADGDRGCVGPDGVAALQAIRRRAGSNLDMTSPWRASTTSRPPPSRIRR